MKVNISIITTNIVTSSLQPWKNSLLFGQRKLGKVHVTYINLTKHSNIRIVKLKGQLLIVHTKQ